MKFIPLSALDLALAGTLVLALAAVNAGLGYAQARRIVLAAARTTLQLLLIGFVLRALFRFPFPGWIALMALVLLAAAGTGFGLIPAVRLGARQLFDERDRLRLDRLGG